jgi:hypothetical protein
MAENKNNNVVVAFFKDEARAQSAIDTLKTWDDADDEVKLGAIGTIYKEGDKVKTHVPHKVGKGAVVGATVGIIAGALTGGIGLLGGVLAGGAMGGVTGAFLKQDVNLNEEEIDRIGEQLDAGSYAVVVACDDYEVDPVREQMKDSGGDVWEYAVTKEAMKAAEDYITRAHHISSSIQLTEEEARETAEEAYIFAYPMIENYRTALNMAVLKDSPGYRGPFNQFTHNRDLLDPSFTDVVRPNNDTLYSMAWLDLRSEPVVISVPEVPDDRYYVLQLVDLYTHNFAYIGTRTTGNGAGNYLIAGPYYQGKKREGIDKIFRSEGNFVFCVGRTAVDGPDDLDAARAVMEQFKITPLDQFVGQPRVEPSAPLSYPLYDEEQAHSAGFITYLNFLLGQLDVHPDDEDDVVSYGGIGVGRNRPFDPDSLHPNMRKVIEEGVELGHQKIQEKAENLGEVRNGWILMGRVFGNRERMHGKYLTRAAAAMVGLYGNDIEEAYYPSTNVDADGEALDASQHNYTITFAADEIPAVDAFWSLTLYKLPEQLLVENPINRYSIGDRTPGLQYGDDGSLTIYIQAESPGADKESNWLPANKGPFSLTLRMYLPKPEALEGPYAPPPVQKA